MIYTIWIRRLNDFQTATLSIYLIYFALIVLPDGLNESVYGERFRSGRFAIVVNQCGILNGFERTHIRASVLFGKYHCTVYQKTTMFVHRNNCQLKHILSSSSSAAAAAIILFITSAACTWVNVVFPSNVQQPARAEEEEGERIEKRRMVVEKKKSRSTHNSVKRHCCVGRGWRSADKSRRSSPVCLAATNRCPRPLEIYCGAIKRKQCFLK